jgi:predicted nucleic acid-binding protein
MLDTSVAIHLRDGDPLIVDRVEALGEAVVISVVTSVELEGGVHVPTRSVIRRERLDAILGSLPSIAFDDAAVKTYGSILAAVGYSRRKVLDRMIAAQALNQSATLVTMNPGDFNDVPGLKVLAW